MTVSASRPGGQRAALAHAGLGVTALAWGAMIPIVYLLLERWDAFALSASRYALATPLMLALTWLREGPPRLPLETRWWQLSLVGAVGIGGLATFLTLGLAHSDPLTAIVIQSAGPVTTILVAWALFRVRAEKGTGVALVLAVVGGFLVSWPKATGAPRSGFRGGELLLVLGSGCWAWYSLACQRWLGGASQLRLTALTFVPGSASLVAVYLLAWALGLTRTPAPVPVLDIVLILWMTIVSTCLGVLLWNHGVNRLGLPTASLYLNAVPVFAVLITMAFGVIPTGMQLVGGLLVLAGVAQVQLRRAGSGR